MKKTDLSEDGLFERKRKRQQEHRQGEGTAADFSPPMIPFPCPSAKTLIITTTILVGAGFLFWSASRGNHSENSSGIIQRLGNIFR